MTKIVTFAAAALIAIAAAGQANAELTQNGRCFNGRSANGIGANGATFSGVAITGIDLAG